MTLSGRICECGHDLTYHRNQKDRHGKPRLVCVHFEGFTPCTCKNFKEVQTKLEGTMAEKEPKVVQFAPTAKESKALLDTENTSQLAKIYRAVVKNGPLEFDALWKEVSSTFSNTEIPIEKRKTHVRTYLSRLHKSGLVKRVSAEVEPKERKPRKARKSKVADSEPEAMAATA